VVRREQEDLVGDALDAATQTEDEAGGEVDEPLRVTVVHLGEVHDDRDALSEVLADRARVVVGPRLQRRDPVGLDRGRSRAWRRTLEGRGTPRLGGALDPTDGRRRLGARVVGDIALDARVVELVAVSGIVVVVTV